MDLDQARQLRIRPRRRFGGPVPVGVLGAFYVQAGRIADLSVLLGAFGLAWSAFEVWTWTSAASDAAVTIPGWTPVPLATSVALLIIGVAIAIAGFTRGR